MNKRPIIKAIGCLLLAVVLMVAAVPVTPVQAAYENTYVNTGNQRQDLIGVALTQVGYREGWNNDTKYGAWYSTQVGWNMNYNPWCAMFISWCAHHAGIPRSVIALNSFASVYSFGLTDTFTYASGRVPQPGDLFDRQGEHAGIVYQVDVANDTFVTIEGNTNDNGWDGVGVFIRYHRLSDTRYVFASPYYTSDHTHNYNTGVETAHPHKEYKQCSICNDKSYTGSTKFVDTCIECIQANCTHSYDSWKKADDNRHQHTCSKCSKVEAVNHNWNAGTVTKPASCKEPGAKAQTCQGCGAKRTVEIPKLQTHSYGAWEKTDEEQHSRKCTVCSKVDTQDHNCPEEWSTSDSQHWFECADCRELVDLGDHDFNDNCENPCSVCGYEREGGHRLSESWDISENGHYYSCQLCPYQASFAAHSISPELASDSDGHYYPCTVCGYRHELAVHTPGQEATEEAAQLCTDCGYEIAPKLEHIHDFMPLEQDKDTHWGVCRCGTNFGPENHRWDITTKACAICKVPMQVQKSQIPWFWINVAVCAVAGILVVSLLIVMIVAIVKKRKKQKVLQEV